MLSSLQVDYSGLRISCLEAATAILVSLNRHKDAENLLQEALKKEAAPRIHELLDQLQNKQNHSEEDLLRKGQELLANQAYIEASKIFIQIVESNPQSFQAFNGLGLVSWYFEKYDDAYILFRKAVEIGSENEDILLNVLDAAQITGQLDDARAMLLEALNRNPGMTKIKELLDA
jgi:tetratricopeptide (TPR) repeat protein